MVKIACPKCNSKKLYKMSSGKRRCSECKYDFIPHNLPLRLTRDEWKQIIHLFLMEQNSNSIIERTRFERRRVFRALTKIRLVLAKDVPDIFSGTVEVDETYVGGQWKNKRKSIRDHGTKRGRGTKKQPVFGILCRNGQVWAEVVDDVGAETLQPLISRKVSTGSTICSDTWKAYTGIAARGYVHRLVNHGERQYSDGKGNHINGLEGFWGFLKRKLASKGGITNQKLPLYLAEYIWRYNHRNDSDKIKMRRILVLLEKS
ncbi:MAG TPA: IS1595 family transposase [Methanocorpusculum sp.]|nr:IS1595 family transposase [Methanocorpusculum sp.]